MGVSKKRMRPAAGGHGACADARVDGAVGGLGRVADDPGGPKAVTARHRSHATNSPTSSNRTRSHARAREARNSNQSLASYAYAFSVFGDRSTTVSDSR